MAAALKPLPSTAARSFRSALAITSGWMVVVIIGDGIPGSGFLGGIREIGGSTGTTGGGGGGGGGATISGGFGGVGGGRSSENSTARPSMPSPRTPSDTAPATGQP